MTAPLDGLRRLLTKLILIVHLRCKSSHVSLDRVPFILTCSQYDTGQISDILLMTDFKRRFANGCSIDTTSFSDADSCTFSNVRSGLIVALLSIGTLIGAVCGAP